MSLNHVPRDKNGVPLEHDQIVFFEDREIKSVICGTILQPGTERSTIRYAEGKIKQINNNLIEVRTEPPELVPTNSEQALFICKRYENLLI